MTDRQGYLYILRDPNLPQNVLKIGRTVCLKRRLKGYPSGSIYLDTFGPCVDCHDAERSLIRDFETRYMLYKGKEYFKGNAKEMETIFKNFCRQDPSPMLC
nr:T5orf172 domain-containing protein [Oceanusvirus sp.]